MLRHLVIIRSQRILLLLVLFGVFLFRSSSGIPILKVALSIFTIESSEIICSNFCFAILFSQVSVTCGLHKYRSMYNTERANTHLSIFPFTEVLYIFNQSKLFTFNQISWFDQHTLCIMKNMIFIEHLIKTIIVRRYSNE